MRAYPLGKNKKACKRACLQAFCGGELGIRTLETFRSTAFRVLHLRPLGQLSVSIFVRFSFRKFAQNSLERKQERRQKIFDFEIFSVEEYQGESGGRNSQLLPKFRVSPVMTTSIRLHISCDIFRHHNDNIIHQKKSFVNHFLSFPVSKALLNMLRSKNIIIISERRAVCLQQAYPVYSLP